MRRQLNSSGHMTVIAWIASRRLVVCLKATSQWTSALSPTRCSGMPSRELRTRRACLQQRRRPSFQVRRRRCTGWATCKALSRSTPASGSASERVAHGRHGSYALSRAGDVGLLTVRPCGSLVDLCSAHLLTASKRCIARATDPGLGFRV